MSQQPTSSFRNPAALKLRQRWLVVDDQPELAALLAEVLSGMDLASVEAFVAPGAALAELAARGEGISLVVTDRDMPGLDGLALARGARRHAPQAKTLLVTANANLTPEQMRAAGISAVLAKPFALEELEALVRRLTAPDQNVPVEREWKRAA